MTNSEERSLVVMPEPEAQGSTLISMLQYRRPAGSRTERKFIADFISPLGTTTDKKGNHFIRIGDAPIMWSCHTDSVHRAGGFQKVVKKGTTGFTLGVSTHDTSNCLGADDAAGVWLMREMILKEVPGLYVFHRYEESGCHGSRWLVKNNPDLVRGIKYALALDRKGKQDIITYQSGTRCCSDEFAASLGYQLELGYKACEWGSFTDTAQYTDLIGECTNLSVGYNSAHTSSEDLDVVHLLQLLDKLIHLDVKALVDKRKPGEKEPAKTYGYYSRNYQYDDGGYYGSDGAPYPYGSYGGGYSEYYCGTKQYSLIPGTNYPRKGEFGYWDADGKYCNYQELPLHTPVRKSYELRLDYMKWWENMLRWPKLFHGSSATNTQRSNGSAAGTYVPSSNVAKINTGRKNGKVKHQSYLPSNIIQSASRKIRDFRDEDDFDITSRATATMSRLVENHPDEVADFLEQYGVSCEEIMQHILATTGMLRLR
ncbi:MAG TPA: hypothetical protein VFR24_27625 [Candidatus Angelobacter sp.]|nr:hypothetical protein [Candidatus Angelobacter sp.]